MKILNKHWFPLLGIIGGGMLMVAVALTAWSQTAPTLTIAPTGTNAVSITVNGTNSATYYLEMTPILGNTNFPWTIIANGAPGQTNFTVSMLFNDSFFQVLVATNNPGQGLIAVFIDNPTNGAVVQ